MSKPRQFIQCDVFTSQPTKGNALAVVLDGEGLTEDQMQAFAAWTNLAETTFLFPPTMSDADYKVRIFTPSQEMPFAGHPTLGSCMSWLRSGGVPKSAGIVRQECAVGIIEIDVITDVPAFVAPPTKILQMADDERSRITNQLQIPEELICAAVQLDNGPVWQVLELSSAQDVLNVDSAKVRWPEFQAIGLIGRQPDGAETDFEVRMLAPSSGMSEDPITGSLNAALACWLQTEGRLQPKTVISQGTNVNRSGRVFVRSDDTGKILIGGEVQFLIEGTVEL
ncbi:PhzF family phenazine biosynthesis protein [Sulfitobacter sp. MF3-043]|uniref:PhzF family phenazine biosynthesis protein n=1 Tax=Sulfitobacter sediminivivens TaxID=3252902 RepID=UPI0036DA0552